MSSLYDVITFFDEAEFCSPSEYFLCLFPLQAYIELGALEEVLQPFIDDVSKDKFDRIREHLASWDVQPNER